MSKRIIYYYQTFSNDLTPIIENTKCTHIHIASIHFGTNTNNTPYIHLNNNIPDDKIYNKVWSEAKELNSNGTKILLMIGGAGGGYTTLFSDFETYYKLLYTTLKERPFISGVDLDVEEYLGDDALEKIQMFIKRLNTDFGNDFLILTAPV